MTDRRAVSAAGAALALALMAGCGPKPVADAAAPADAPAAPRPVLSSNLDQIQNQYAADPVAARAKYQATAVQFTAYADQSEPAASGDLVIAFHTTAHPQPVRAVFLKAAAAAHGPVRAGELVQSRCDTVAEAAGKVELHGCVFR